MPDIHIGLVELVIALVVSIFSYGAVQWQTNQNKRDIELLWRKVEADCLGLKKEFDKDIEKLTTKTETLEKDILEKLSTLLVSVAEIKGQLKEKRGKQNG